MSMFTSGQLADPLMFGVTRPWHHVVSQVAVHSTVPPVILLVLIFNERRHYLHKDWPGWYKSCKSVRFLHSTGFLRGEANISVLTGEPSDHSQAPGWSGSLLFKPTQNQRPSVLKNNTQGRKRKQAHRNLRLHETGFPFEKNRAHQHTVLPPI